MVRYVLLLSMDEGMSVVIYGTFTYTPANGQWCQTVGAMDTLTVMFFCVYAGVAPA